MNVYKVFRTYLILLVSSIIGMASLTILSFYDDVISTLEIVFWCYIIVAMFAYGVGYNYGTHNRRS